MVHSLRPPTPIEDTHTWHTYAQTLYDIPHQTPPTSPTLTLPTSPTLFTTSMVKKAIKNLQNGKSMDHTGLQSEQLIYAAPTLS